KPSMARAGARMMRSSLRARLTAQSKGSAKVRRRRAAEAHIGMRGNLARLMPPRLLPRALLAASLLLSGCDTMSNLKNKVFGPSGPAEGQLGYVRGFLGGVAADEPRAALI